MFPGKLVLPKGCAKRHAQFSLWQRWSSGATAACRRRPSDPALRFCRRRLRGLATPRFPAPCDLGGDFRWRGSRAAQVDSFRGRPPAVRTKIGHLARGFLPAVAVEQVAPNPSTERVPCAGFWARTLQWVHRLAACVWFGRDAQHCWASPLSRAARKLCSWHSHANPAIRPALAWARLTSKGSPWRWRKTWGQRRVACPPGPAQAGPPRPLPARAALLTRARGSGDTEPDPRQPLGALGGVAPRRRLRQSPQFHAPGSGAARRPKPRG